MAPTVSFRWTAVLLCAAASGLQGQISSAAGVGALLQRDAGGLWQSMTRIEPALRFDSPWGRLGGDAAVRGGANGTRMERGNLDVVAETPAWRGFRISNSATIEREDVRSGFANRRGTAESVVSFGAGGRGAWAGVAYERSPGSAARSSFHGDALRRFGMWQQWSAFTFALSSAEHGALETHYSPEHTIDTAGVTVQQVKIVDVHRWSDVEARLSWAYGRVALDSRFGMQRDTGVASSVLWGNATATFGIAPRISAVGTFGTRPSRVWTGTPSSRFASLGIRVAPSILARPTAAAHVQPVASRFSVRPVDGGMYVVAVRAPSARSVELSGDFNGWQALVLHETSPDRWEATIPLAPGTYHVNMRVNGASWVAPPGLSSTDDEFNGTVGLLIIP